MQFQVVPLSPMVKKLIILNVGIWFFLQLILENLFLSQDYITQFFSFTPKYTLENFFIWQPLTYMFLHSKNVFHVILNMVSLWFFGSELEYRWGAKSFLLYYLACGVGAAFIYFIGVIVVGLVQGHEPLVYVIPVLGASGAVFGVLLAYGILFGDRIIYFFGVFPMKAKIFLMIIGGIEVVSLLSAGMGGSNVANLAHIGGLISGYLYLLFWTRWQQNRWRGAKNPKARRNLRLVVNNDNKKDDQGPKYWN
ncbi:MAG: rhomboid family intramembrane serine protease [Pseudomonadota bacterium]